MSRLSYEDVGITEPEEGVIQFEVTKEHLKLLRGMQLQWQGEDWGGLQTNPKRPYGSLDGLIDMRRLTEIPDLSYDEAHKLHKGAAMALQITLKTGKYKAALFRAQKYGQDWHEYTPKKPKKVKDAPEEQIALDAAEAGVDA